jgi:hypothetical protein
MIRSRTCHSEAFYIRDEVKRKYWSPTPGPVNSSGFYRVIHGFGFTRFEHFSNGLDQTLIQFVPQHEPVKISKLILKNRVAKPGRLSVFRYLERVLGVERTSASDLSIRKSPRMEKPCMPKTITTMSLPGEPSSWPSSIRWTLRNSATHRPAALYRTKSLPEQTPRNRLRSTARQQRQPGRRPLFGDPDHF